MKTVNLNDEVSIISVKKLPETTTRSIKKFKRKDARTKRLKRRGARSKSTTSEEPDTDIISNMLECELTEYGDADEEETNDFEMGRHSYSMKKTIKETYKTLPSSPEEQAEVLSKLAEQALLKLEAMSSDTRRKSLSAIFDNKHELL